VKPLYEKGDGYDMQIYRPISIISVFAKILERLMYNRIISFLYENEIFTEAQNGFRKGKCIETAVQSFFEMIQEALDNEFTLLEYLLISPLWSSGQCFWLQIQRSRVRFPALPDFSE